MTQLWKRLLWSGVLVSIASYAIFFSPWWFFLAVVEGFVILGLL